MKYTRKEIQKRHTDKMRAAGKRLYAARISATIADAIVATAKRQGVTAAALTEKILSDYLQLDA